MKGKQFLVLFLILTFLSSIIGCGGNTPVTTNNKANIQVQMDDQKATLFVDALWLKDNIDKVNIIDARKDTDYNKGHIAGAVNATWQSWCNVQGKPGDPGWGVVLSKDELAAKISALGISGEKPVIVYAQPPGWGEEGCILWMLKMAGIKDARMLDGGFAAWEAIQGQVSKEAFKPAAAQFKIASYDESWTATTDYIKNNQGQIKIVDSRSDKEYQGAIDYGEARGGHLPAAISIPFNNLFNKDNTLKNSEQLKQIFTAAGLKTDDEIITYCTAGIRSAYMALVLRSQGFGKARNYDASFYEWAGNKSLAVEK